MNEAILIGNLTRDPESGTTTNGVSWCRFTIAVNRPYTDQNGQRQTDFLRIVTWRGTAENCRQYLRKGRQICVVGRIEIQQYDDQEGQHHEYPEIVAEKVKFLGTRPQEPDDVNY